jgi:CheY-like chemotaxis protein
LNLDELMSTLRVLAIDDELCVLRSYARGLRARFEVVTAANAEDALALLETSSPFDAVLCDMHMRGMSGFELFEEVLRHSPEQARRFIWVTGSVAGFSGHKEVAGQPVLNKPFTLDQLEAALAGVVGA